jgi:hypothetical protein
VHDVLGPASRMAKGRCCVALSLVIGLTTSRPSTSTTDDKANGLGAYTHHTHHSTCTGSNATPPPSPFQTVLLPYLCWLVAASE